MARKAAAPGGGKKRKRRKMKLTLKSRRLKSEQGYTDKVGWSQVQNNSPVDTGPVEPQVIRHQCTMCGAMNQIPKPKRSRYKVQCANPDCGHVDELGVV
ncbi:MAG: hypothetical protein VYC11_04920 [Candidatus Thermoplasmatota archaeon]|nr:hypothetical protein [Euryarchaeota archaeon]MEC7704386.1 hypothetical protein [Candidatus Thermoplasmatota archaeon]MEC9090693.1 hypothetical protein [Candidatus Thermoplasmatota archaeon]MED5486530.1 hypothetical protein [Candidatus Thermoplasmatota archaeon]